jgi:calmodulin
MRQNQIFYLISTHFVGNGYITTETLKEILAEIDPTLSEDNLDQIVEEVDADDSGTVDFHEFMQMMTGE